MKNILRVLYNCCKWQYSHKIFKKHKLLLLCVIWFLIISKELWIPRRGNFLRGPWFVLSSQKESVFPWSPYLVAIWSYIREESTKCTGNASVCIHLSVTHIIWTWLRGWRHDGKLEDVKEWSKVGGEVGKWIELTVFRLRIVHKERKWVLAAHGHAIDQLGMPGSKFHAI